jgi:CheY-like chemotaxis protein
MRADGRMALMSNLGVPMSGERAVLVVDDDAVLREFIEMALTEQGFRVNTAADGLQAVQSAAVDHPALVLMDVGIPNLNGSELVSRLQETCLTRLPCVVMSGGQPGPEILQHACVVGFLSKPFDLDALFSTVQRYACATEPSLLP